MTPALAELLDLAPDVLLAFFLVFLRIGAAMFVLPVFGEAVLSLPVRLAVALAFTSVVFSSLPQWTYSGSLQLSDVVVSFLAEIIAGLLIGFVLRLHVMAIQIAAMIAAQSTSLSQLLGGTSIDPQPALGMILYMAALALAVEFGLHVQFALMFVLSFQLVGPGEFVDANVVLAYRDAISAAFRFAFVLAAPFVAVSILYNLGLGVINRAMPQLMVAFVGAPAITFGALLLLFLSAPLILEIWVDVFRQQLPRPFGG